MNKVILLTGAASALGQLMVKTLADKGNQVIATMRKIEELHQQTAAQLALIDNVTIMQLDVTDEVSVKNTIAQVIKQFGKIDVLVNNAVVQGTGLLEGYSIYQFQKMMDTNLYGVLRLYKEVLPVMRKAENGLIINISSSCGRISTPFQIPYNASRFALEGLVEGVYQELAPLGIECVLLEPGPFIGGLYDNQTIDADRTDILSAYGAETAVSLAEFNAKVGEALQRYQPEIKPIAQAVASLIEMENGTRPLRTPLDPVAQGTDIKYDELTAKLKSDWLLKYME
ncbi:SDR family oxidoreductase [Pedobacter sp.]|uniref:SDR family oxidoreductase n=1 Tax=Pedobacter sp. TaxID=1411316 RepID=UPI003C607F7B